MPRSDLRLILDSFRLDELEEGCRRGGLPVSGSADELRERIAKHLEYDHRSAPEVFTIELLNGVSVRLGGRPRRDSTDAVSEIYDRIRRGEELDEAAALDDAQDRRRAGLDAIISRPSVRPVRLRGYLKGLHAVDRELFFALARNRPGPGAPIQNPLDNGFVALRDLDANAARDAVDMVDRRMTRTSAFQRAISLTHQLAPNFEIYIGRTYVRRQQEHLGLVQRWTDHWRRKDMTYACVLALSHREQVERDEDVAVRLIKLWHDFGLLCCNNNVLSRTPSKAEDPMHAIYMCIRRR